MRSFSWQTGSQELKAKKRNAVLPSRRSCPGFLRDWSRFFWASRAEPGQERKEGRDFEGHFLGCGGDGHGLRLDQFELIVPRVDLDAATERQRRDLVGFLR